MKKTTKKAADDIFLLSVCEHGLDGIRKIAEKKAKELFLSDKTFKEKEFFQRCGVV